VDVSAQTALFENQPIRRVYDEATQTWWFSVVDIIRILTQQPDANVARKYWNKLKQRLRDEGSELVTNCHQFKLTAEDGKQRNSTVSKALLRAHGGDSTGTQRMREYNSHMHRRQTVDVDPYV
jgi:hypothetical protein